MPSKHGTILAAVKTVIAGLTLDGIASTNVQRLMLPLVDRALKLGTLKLPAVVISPVTGGESIVSGATNLDDDVGYPCTIGIITTADYLVSEENEEKYLLWRETIREAFQTGRLAGASGVWRVQVEPANIVSLNAWVSNSIFVSGLVVRAVQRDRVRG